MVLAILVLAACGPAADDGDGTSTSSTGAGDATVTTSGGNSTTAATTATTAGTASTSDAGETTTTTTSDDDAADDDVPKFDMIGPDAPPLLCPIEPAANAEVVGSSPLGAIDTPHGWYGLGGGGKCPYGFEVYLLPSTDDALAQLEQPWPRLDEGIYLMIHVGWGAEPPHVGELEVTAWHLHAGEGVSAAGIATIEMSGSGEDPQRLVGSFTIDDPAWELSGTFDLPWCDLLESGACGA